MSHQRTIGTLRSIMAAVLMASLSVVAAPLLVSTMVKPASAQQPDQQPPPGQLTDDARAVLSQYGNFVQHQVYGEVWIPSVTPQGWHPYPPCHWVKTEQYGWYYDDQTPWGGIVHHYGRWTNDPQVGWFWVPGSEFSPGWVLWRTSLQWVGWAPMPPDEQIQHGTPDQFNTADFWIFMETAKFDANCDAGAVVASQRGLPLVQQTTFVRDVNIVGGILVYALPTYVIGPLVDINLNFDPWPPWFFGQIMIDWNWIWNNVDIVVNVNNVNCPPQAPIGPAAANKPPPPPAAAVVFTASHSGLAAEVRRRRSGERLRSMPDAGDARLRAEHGCVGKFLHARHAAQLRQRHRADPRGRRRISVPADRDCQCVFRRPSARWQV